MNRWRLYVNVTAILTFIAVIAFLFLYPRRMTTSPTKNADTFAKGAFTVAASSAAYFDGATGWYAEPSEPGAYPGVIMIHEWWGLNDTIKQMAELLATHGYRVLAVDLYQGKVATTTQDAQAYVTSARNNPETMVRNMRAAAAYLRDRQATKLASFGWCFGGGQSLAFALSGERLDATVLYYGTPLITDKEKLKTIRWPVLGIFGDQDQAIPTDKATEFDRSLTELDIVHEVVIYPGVGHAFANPSGQNYAPGPTSDAWQKTIDFLKKNLEP